MTKKNKLLSFEEFFKERKTYPGQTEIRSFNIIAYWTDGIAGETFRQSPHGRRFQEEYSGLDNEILKQITQKSHKKDWAEIPGLRDNIYRAYTIMHEEYDVPNELLF